MVLGDGEEVVGEITEAVAAWKLAGKPDRMEILRTLAGITGVYVPRLYDAVFADGMLVEIVPNDPGRARPRSRSAPSPTWGSGRTPSSQLVPLTEVVHDRLNVEVFRGCTRGCRFCQAGMITRPVRERPADQVRTMVSEGLKRTGYDEVALTSLSTADFSGIEQVVIDTVNDPDCGGQISVSLPSLRVDAFTVGIAGEIQKARRTGLTFAPEAGTWRMRQVINKLIREEDLYAAVRSAYSQGWRRMKLYFLTGLPTETDEDTLGIATLARNCVAIGKEYHKNPSVTVSLGGFVPKPFTPFQWFGQNTREELQRKIYLLRDELRRDHAIKLKWHDPKATMAEGLVSRGDRRLGVGHRGRVAPRRHLPGVGRALRPPALARRARARPGSARRTSSTATAPRTRPCRGTTSRPGSTRTSSGRTGATPSPRSASRTAAGPPATTAAPAPATASSTWSPRRCPPAGGSQGTGQDLTVGGEVPVTLLPSKPGPRPGRPA